MQDNITEAFKNLKVIFIKFSHRIILYLSEGGLINNDENIDHFSKFHSIIKWFQEHDYHQIDVLFQNLVLNSRI